MPEVREERRIITALFADVVGSTAPAERLDPEDVKLVVGEAISRMIRVVESYGGTIQDLAGDGPLGASPGDPPLGTSRARKIRGGRIAC